MTNTSQLAFSDITGRVEGSCSQAQYENAEMGHEQQTNDTFLIRQVLEGTNA